MTKQEVQLRVSKDETNEGSGDTNTNLRRSIGDVANDVNNFTLRGGSVRVQTLSADTTLEALTADYLVDGAYTITLPPAADWILFGGSSIQISIKNAAGAGDSVTVEGNGSETIDGAGNKALAQYRGVVLISNGTNIFIKSQI